MTRGEVRGHPRPADAGRREARPRAFRRRHRPRPRRRRARQVRRSSSGALAGRSRRGARPTGWDERRWRMREIVFDTETTGLDPMAGDRIVEIGCVELLNHIPTGRTLPRLHQSRARHAARRPSRCTASPTRSWPTSRSSPRSPTSSWPSSAMRGSSPTTPRSTSASSMPSWRGSAIRRSAPERVVDTLAIARRKHPSGPTAWTRCASATASTIPPHQARRPARRRDPRRSLCRAARRPAGRPRPRRDAAARRSRRRGPAIAPAPGRGRQPLPPRLTRRGDRRPRRLRRDARRRRRCATEPASPERCLGADGDEAGSRLRPASDRGRRPVRRRAAAAASRETLAVQRRRNRSGR